MNWDWDKLQQRRQGRPSSEPPRPGFDRLGDGFPRFKFNSGWMVMGCIAIVVIWLLSGFFTVDAPERGVVLRFGAFSRAMGPGLHYHWPWPIEGVEKVNVEEVRRVEVGFYSLGRESEFQQGELRVVPEESLMLTGDENIVDVQFIVQFQVRVDEENLGVRDYLFNVKDQTETVKSVAEAAMREVIGENDIDGALTDGKEQIQNDTEELIQEVLDSYTAGIDVISVQMQDVHPPEEVIDAFKDVASAREDRERQINKAHAYSNDILPRARGQAEQMKRAAEAYKERVSLEAEGEASRFLAILHEYQMAPEITRQRLFIEAMETVLANPTLIKIILMGQAGEGTVPLLPLDSLTEPSIGGGEGAVSGSTIIEEVEQ
ncbi:MAG: FtsH protease activity modulator HflK [Desulfovibrio sp.]|nr:MAG: FtsH protease activity modulator HflK [Desulfovibrio sp.]